MPSAWFFHCLSSASQSSGYFQPMFSLYASLIMLMLFSKNGFTYFWNTEHRISVKASWTSDSVRNKTGALLAGFEMGVFPLSNWNGLTIIKSRRSIACFSLLCAAASSNGGRALHCRTMWNCGTISYSLPYNMRTLIGSPPLISLMMFIFNDLPAGGSLLPTTRHQRLLAK